MRKQPNVAIFCCESCSSQLKTDARMGAHVMPWKRKLPIASNGTCAACGGESWTIVAVYAEESTNTGPTAIGLGLAATTSVGFVQTSTSSNQVNCPNVPAAVVAKLNQEPSLRMSRVGDLITIKERQRLENEGAIKCRVCGVLFVSALGKLWCQKGYCSKGCAVEGGEFAVVTDEESVAAERTQLSTVSVQCAAGHDFDVPLSFRGLTRPCPTCGMKTEVPLDNL